MAYGLSRIQLPESGMDFTELPSFLLCVCGDCLGGQKRPGTFRMSGQRIQTPFCSRIEPDGRASVMADRTFE
jgi:hypothetical protein